MKQLEDYARKRDFRKTAEPKAKTEKSRRNRFVIQKHAATRLHYDFRLEINGVLKSWAVPKGIPTTKGDKRLAVQVEDHPVSYIDFEGTIPKGQYGGGTVMVWDRGTFSADAQSPSKELDSGKLHFTLDGKKLCGDWYLVRLRDGNNWLLIKSNDSMKPISAKADDTSALSGKTMKQLGEIRNVWESNRAENKNSLAEKIRNLVVERARPGRSSTRLASNHSSDERTPSRAGSWRRSPRHLKFIEPMKAKLAASPPAHGDWIYEIKFDGFRAIALKNGRDVQLLSRNNKEFNDKFSEIAEAVAGLEMNEAIFDGEIVALDKNGVSSFQLLQAFELGQERPPIFFYVFDLLQLNGKDLKNLPLTERKSQLTKILEKHDGLVRYSDSLGDDAQKLLKQAEKLGLEGLIVKRADSVYEPGKRSGAWIKLKLHREQEFVIGGYTNPEGSRLHFGALLVGYYENKKLKFCGKVGTGFNTKLLSNLHSQFKTIARNDCPFVNLPESRAGRYGAGVTKAEMKRCHWIKPKLVCQIKFSEWTRDDKLRQPVFLGLREDKDANEVVREKVE